MSEAGGARARILGRLKAAPRTLPPVYPAPGVPAWTPPAYGDDRLERFRRTLEAGRGEVHDVTADDWPERLKALLIGKGVTRLLHGPGTEAGRRLVQAWGSGEGPATGPIPVPYDRPVEALKPVLVGDVEAGLTTARGAIADTGSLIVWPSPDEPRLMSLLPPIHVVLLEAGRVVDSLAQVMAEEGWASGMPTNLLLISGPSKSADIEQTLAHGVHGPKELVVLVIGR